MAITRRGKSDHYNLFCVKRSRRIGPALGSKFEMFAVIFTIVQGGIILFTSIWHQSYTLTYATIRSLELWRVVTWNTFQLSLEYSMSVEAKTGRRSGHLTDHPSSEKRNNSVAGEKRTELQKVVHSQED